MTLYHFMCHNNGLTFIGLRDFHSAFAQYVELVTQSALFYDVVPFRIKFLQKQFQLYEKITVVNTEVRIQCPASAIACTRCVFCVCWQLVSIKTLYNVMCNIYYMFRKLSKMSNA